MNIKVEKDKERLDIYLTSVTDYSRSKIKTMILDGKILVNDEEKNPNYLVHVGDVISISPDDEDFTSLVPEKMNLDIVYEDDYLAVINKPSGLVVHPAVGNTHGTLANGLLDHFNTISKDKTIRPGIVHRLDKNTSGLMVVAKDDKTHELLSDMLKHKKVERVYIALVYGVLKHDRGTIDAPLGRDLNNRQKYTVTDINSKNAVTHFRVLERYSDATLLELKLDTGRTHQIRVHLNYIGYPIVNDPVYGKRKLIDPEYGQMLHSKSIKFIHPITNKEIYFEVEPDDKFKEILNIFKD